MTQPWHIRNSLLAKLSEKYPASTEKLRELDKHFSARNRKLSALIHYCMEHPWLDAKSMCLEYSAALDKIERGLPQATPDASSEEGGTPTPNQRRNRTRGLNAATRLLSTSKPFGWEEVAAAKMRTGTLAHCFASPEELVVAAYEQLIKVD